MYIIIFENVIKIIEHSIIISKIGTEKRVEKKSSFNMGEAKPMKRPLPSNSSFTNDTVVHGSAQTKSPMKEAQFWCFHI